MRRGRGLEKRIEAEPVSCEIRKWSGAWEVSTKTKRDSIQSKGGLPFLLDVGKEMKIAFFSIFLTFLFAFSSLFLRDSDALFIGRSSSETDHLEQSLSLVI